MKVSMKRGRLSGVVRAKAEQCGAGRWRGGAEGGGRPAEQERAPVAEQQRSKEMLNVIVSMCGRNRLRAPRDLGALTCQVSKSVGQSVDE